MKTLIFLLVIAAVAIVTTGCNKLSSPPMPAGRLLSYEYNENGMRSSPTHYFSITLSPDSSQAVLVVAGVSEIDRVAGLDDDSRLNLYTNGDSLIVDAALLDTIKNVMTEHKVQRYKDRYYPTFKVLDGYSWYYQARFADDSSLSSGGNNARPNDNALAIINALLVEAYRQQRPFEEQK